MQHLGYVVGPQIDAGWIGEVAPGTSFLDGGSGGPENDSTRRDTRIMTWNRVHVERTLRAADRLPATGNTRG